MDLRGLPRDMNPTEHAFPDGFLWGAATAAHQVEGNNINSDLWVLEHIRPTLFVEPSLDACDHYHRYPEDIGILATLGLNAYRFSIEWARVEPEPGVYSRSALEHYRRMLATCAELGVTPMITLHHFSSPRWFVGRGGWESNDAGDRFVRYSENVAKHLGAYTRLISTFNEPNLPKQLKWVNHIEVPTLTAFQMGRKAAKAIGADRFGCFFLGNAEKLERAMIAAHKRAREAMKSISVNIEVGVNVGMQDEQAAEPGSKRDRKCAEVYDPWLAAAGESDFLGVQVYTRQRVGKKGDIGPEEGAELTQMKYEFWPEALEACIRYARARVSVPIYVTENGVATEDDTRRAEFIARAVAGVGNCLRDGIDVRGYIHWSLLDNFEWIFGYRPKFGLIAVDRESHARAIKPSARFLGQIAKANGRIPAEWPQTAAFGG